MAASLLAPASVHDAFDHPFYPIGVQVSGYAATSISAPALLAIFFTGLACLLVCTRAFLRHTYRHLPSGDIWTAMWFVLCGFVHLCFEGTKALWPLFTVRSMIVTLTFISGYFSLNALDFVRRNDLFAQLWKEYALSDSRYVTNDSFVVCMETVTTFVWGPLSFLCAYCISNTYSLRHPLQLIVSLGQLYGLVLYFGTCAFEEFTNGIIFCRPEHIYYCAYYLACNLFWLFIPAWLIYQSVREISHAFDTAKRRTKIGRSKP